ncbi:hypothetical protein GTP58_29850 [Duganella sp. CY15W]|nr:hypothetical protein [Duganella sp. CY15W]
MGWSIGYDENHQRDIGYGVPAYCDHLGCDKEIDRGVSHLCGFNSDTGEGCGLHFCGDHLRQRYINPALDPEEAPRGPLCDACNCGEDTYAKKPDHSDWLRWKLEDDSWQQWRDENPAEVERLHAVLADRPTPQEAG